MIPLELILNSQSIVMRFFYRCVRRNGKSYTLCMIYDSRVVFSEGLRAVRGGNIRDEQCRCVWMNDCD